MSNIIGAGIVGYGKVGAGGHRRWISEREDIRLVAVCDSTEVRRTAAAQENPGIAVYEAYEKFLENDEIDLVFVTTPPSSHCEIALAACKAGKHVFVDKPFAMTGEQAGRMLDAASEAGVVMHCNQSRRYDGEYQSILDVVHSGKIGTVQHIRRIWSQYGDVWVNYGIEGFNPSWRIQREFGGGMVYDYAPHCGDQILRLVDKPLASVFADVRGIKFSKEVDDHFACFMRFEGGVTAYLEASNMSRIPMPHWYITGTEGCIKAVEVGGIIEVLAEGSETIEEIEPVRRINELHDNLLAACRGDADPIVTPNQLRESMALIDAIFESARDGKAVRIA